MRILTVLFTIATLAVALEFPEAMPREALMGVDKLESVEGSFHEAADIFSCYFDGAKLRVRLPMMVDLRTGENEFERRDVSLEIDFNGELAIFVSPTGVVGASGRGDPELLGVDFMPEWGTIDLFIERPNKTRPRIAVKSFVAGEPADEAVFGPEEPEYYDAHCAFMLHGNQSVSYTDVFRGRFGAEDESGFDEILEVHQLYDIPGNFHISGTLQSAAAWYDEAFNDWISAGVVAGWAEIITSAYAQHIMPFVTDEMNHWAVSIENDMIQYRYGYTPRIGWVPERTFLSPTEYPNAGVNDWIADNFTDNGVWAVILDDNVHLDGYDNRKIYTQTGSGLKLIPRNDNFTGKMHSGDFPGALAVLQGLGSSAEGNNYIVVYADDWEMPASIGEWAGTMPHALNTYRQMIFQCSIESSWLHVWKLTNAVENPNFWGSTITIRYGSHSSIGRFDGYGGGEGAPNAWYTHWAGYPSPSDHRGYNFGTIWNDAKNNLITSPDNNTAQAGWYVLMSKLYETGWHDGLGGPISGWQIRHSSHIKNANAYAEASRWAAGTVFPNCGAFYDDWDNNGDNELVIHNNRVMAIFKHIGGRAHWIFAKGGATGWEGPIAGNCNVYWEGTDGDYNDANHIAPLSDVAVASWDYQHNLYYSNIDYANADSAQISLGNYLLKKTIKIKRNNPYFLVHYDTGPDVVYTKSGFTPDLVDVIWNAQLDRLWGAGYAGWHNPNTRATAALVFGGGGATHSTEFQSTLLKGDEVTGRGGFGYYIYAGELGDVSGLTSPTLASLAGGLSDIFPPRAYTASYHPGTAILEISFGDLVRYNEVNRLLIGIDSDGNGSVEVALDGACVVINTSNARKIRIQLSPEKATQVAGLSMTNPHIHLQAGAFKDEAGNGNKTQTATVGDAVQLHILPNMSITIDGFIDTTEWVHATRVLDDPNDDSEWGAGNEIYDLNLFWDETYLYLGLHGVKEVSPTTNSWLIYIDTHQPTGGAVDLTAIDNWNRSASFIGGFKAHIQYGSWGAMDGDVWRINSPTSSVQITEGVIARTDLTADRPGSELAISWDAIYGLGAGFVLSNAQISVCASFAGTSDGDPLGGDCVPNHSSATFPVLDNFYTQVIDADGDGIPDDFFTIVHVEESSPVKPQTISFSAHPNPFNSAVRIVIDAPSVETQNVASLQIEVFDINGRRVACLGSARQPDETVGAGLKPARAGGSETLPYGTEFIWQPAPSLPSGVYLVRARAGESYTMKKLIYMK